MNTTHGIKEDNSIIVKKLLVTMGHFSDKMLNIKIYSLMSTYGQFKQNRDKICVCLQRSVDCPVQSYVTGWFIGDQSPNKIVKVWIKIPITMYMT